MLIKCVWFCSCLCKVCSHVLLLTLRTLSNSSSDSKAFLRFIAFSDSPTAVRTSSIACTTGITLWAYLSELLVKDSHKCLSSKEKPHNHSTALTTEELADAERLWIIYTCTSTTNLCKMSTWLRQLDLFTDGKGLCGDAVGDLLMLTFRTVPHIQCYFQEIIRWHLRLSRGTQSCKAQRSQGDPDRDKDKVLDCERSKLGEIRNLSLCGMSEIWGTCMPCSTTPSFARV